MKKALEKRSDMKNSCSYLWRIGIQALRLALVCLLSWGQAVPACSFSLMRPIVVPHSARIYHPLAYDPAGRPVRFTDPEGGVSELTYGPMGELLSRKDPNGKLTVYEYDKTVFGSKNDTGKTLQP